MQRGGGTWVGENHSPCRTRMVSITASRAQAPHSADRDSEHHAGSDHIGPEPNWLYQVFHKNHATSKSQEQSAVEHKATLPDIKDTHRMIQIIIGSFDKNMKEAPAQNSGN